MSNVSVKPQQSPHTHTEHVESNIKKHLASPLVKRYVRKGIPNEHRTLIWMAASGSQEQLEKNPGYYQSLLGAQHDPKLVETIRTGQTGCLLLFSQRRAVKTLTHPEPIPRDD